MSTDNPNRNTSKPLASGKPPRDYSDSPLNTKEKRMIYDEPMPHDMLDKASLKLTIGNHIKGLREVLDQLPDSGDRASAFHYLNHAVDHITAALEKQQ